MTRKQAEQAIYEHMKAIKGIVMEYAPDDIYISLCVNSDDGSISFNNAYWELTEEKRIDFSDFGGD